MVVVVLHFANSSNSCSVQTQRVLLSISSLCRLLPYRGLLLRFRCWMKLTNITACWAAKPQLKTEKNLGKYQPKVEILGTRGAVLHHSAETVLCFRNHVFFPSPPSQSLSSG